MGAPNHGRLENGVALRGSRALRLAPGARPYGMPELVGALGRAADAVARKHKGAVLFVGDLSSRTGGPLPIHKSHQSGRDADLGMYAIDLKGRSVPLRRFVAFDGAGRARDGSGLRFDDARNWALVEALLKDPEVEARYFFITNELRARLLAYAAKKDVRPELALRAAGAMMSPANADPHDDHFHFRIACPESSKEGCVEESLAPESAPSLQDAVAQAPSSDSVAPPASVAAMPEREPYEEGVAASAPTGTPRSQTGPQEPRAGDELPAARTQDWRAVRSLDTPR